MLVVGEAGIGKTVLVERWRPGGAVRLVGRCDRFGRDLPLQPVLDAIERHLAGLDAEAVEAALGPDADVVGPLLGRRPQPAARQLPQVIADAGAAAAVLAAALLAVVQRLAGGAAVVLVVEDLHLAGEGTLEWLRFATRRGRRLLVVGTSRPGDDSPLPDAVPVNLGPLDLEAASSLVGPDRAAELHGRSGGHPLLLVELAAATSDDLPASITDAVAARAAELGAAAATVLAAAVLGPVVDLDLVAAVVERPTTAVFDDLDGAVRAGLLAESGSALAFTHDLVREALEASTRPARRALLHRQAARVLAARPRHDALEVAFHAAHGGDGPLAATALVEAGASAIARRDLVAAEALYDRAIEADDTAAARLARGRNRLARGRFDEAGDDGDVALAQGAGSDAFELLGWIAYYRRDFVIARGLADEGARRTTEPGLRARCLALAGRVRHSMGDLAGADAALTEAVEVAPPADSPVPEVWLGCLRLHQGELDEAVDRCTRGVLDPARLAHPFAEVHGLLARAHALGLRSEVGAALAAVDATDEAIARQDERGLRFRACSSNYRAWLLRSTGRTDEADDLNRLVPEIGVGPSMVEPTNVSYLDLAAACLDRGDPDGAERELRRTTVPPDEAGTMAWHQRERRDLLLAEVLLAGDDHAAAATSARSVAAEAGGRGSRRYAALARLLVVEAELRAGRPIDVEAAAADLVLLDRLAGLEGWRVTARLAAAGGPSAWWAEAERRAARLVATSPDPAATSAWLDRRLGALGRG